VELAVLTENEVNWEKGKSQNAQCEIKLRNDKQKMNRVEE
jgi:hypothetical protein